MLHVHVHSVDVNNVKIVRLSSPFLWDSDTVRASLLREASHALSQR